jgi:uroporphyrinogen decarboxylase
MTLTPGSAQLSHRDRVLKTFNFSMTDHPAYDLMEGCVWSELMDYFRGKYGFQDAAAVLDFLDTDFRWAFVDYRGPSPAVEEQTQPTVKHHSKDVTVGPLAHATTIQEVEALPWPDPAWWQASDYGAFSRAWPEHARVLCIGWTPLFWGACDAFGMENALIKMIAEPKVFDAYIRRQHEFHMDILTRCAKAAEGYCDICWLGDDVASQQSLLMNPALWRRHIKPYLAEQVRVAREHGMKVLFHSCGAVRAILPDLIDIGVNAHLVFQTTARGMDAPSIARDFGGKMVFYGGVDIQHLLSFGTPEETMAEVQANLRAFEKCGGYVVANSHHTVASIKGENIEAMCQFAKETI